MMNAKKGLFLKALYQNLSFGYLTFWIQMVNLVLIFSTFFLSVAITPASMSLLSPKGINYEGKYQNFIMHFLLFPWAILTLLLTTIVYFSFHSLEW